MIKNWKPTVGVLSVILFVLAATFLNHPILSLNNVVFGYGGGYAAVNINPPSISNIKVAASSKEATITWTTSDSSISWVVYGTSTAYGLEVKTAKYVTSHSVILPDLSPSTTYHFAVKSKDSAGNVGTYSDKDFTTLASGEIPITPEEEKTTTTEEEKVVSLEEIKIPTLEKSVSEMTTAELQAKIQEFTVAINQLQILLTQLSGTPSAGCTITSFGKNLTEGDSNDDVKCLQIILNKSVDTQVAGSGVGSKGNETNYFGPLTKAAVIKFQEKYASEILTPLGLTSGTGIVGEKTRLKLDTLIGD